MFTGLALATEHDLRVFVKNTTDGREFLHLHLFYREEYKCTVWEMLEA